MSDLISRQDVIKAVFGSNLSACMAYGRSEEGMAIANELIQAIKNLPSAEPERKKGKWEQIYIKHGGYTCDKRTLMARESAYCTACRAIVPELKNISRGDSKYRTICNVFKFCPNCGARME